MFSERTAWDTGQSLLAKAILEARAAGRHVIDLTRSNPTRCGFDYAAEALLAPLGNSAALDYDPDPRGMRSAREAVARYYAELAQPAAVEPDHLLLTTSTSEAYSFLFRLLANAGDEVLTAQPGYPLFDFLATLDDLRIESYPLFYDFGWSIDFAELERRIGPRTRAIVVVHPNNPTGHATSAAERRQLEQLCVRHGLALIVDEVFLDYSLGEPLESFATGEHPCPTFVVSGLSKVAALPQMKVGWLAVFGPAELRDEALRRLEIVADTFLSLSTLAQVALPAWLASREAIARQILRRVRANLAALHGPHLTVLPVAAGWSALLKLSSLVARRDIAAHLVSEAGVSTHPGEFYSLPGERYLVISLLLPQEEFAKGVEKLNKWMNLASNGSELLG